MIVGKRVGAQVLVYVDTATNQPGNIARYEDDLSGTHFPFMGDEADIRRLFPGRELKFLEPPAARNPESTHQADEARVLSIMGEKPQANPPPPAPSGAKAPGLQIGLEREFEDLLRRCKAARGKEQRELQKEIEAVGSFLINAAPEMEPVLVRIREQITTEKRRFSL